MPKKSKLKSFCGQISKKVGSSHLFRNDKKKELPKAIPEKWVRATLLI
jgi:hypothetical protein